MKKTHREGIILITLLWLIVLLTVMVYQIAFEIRLNKSLVSNQIAGSLKASALNTGIIILMQKLKQDIDLMLDHPMETQLRDDSFRKIKISPNMYMSVFYHKNINEDQKGDMIYGIFPENGLFNINTVPKTILEKIREASSFKEEIWACLLDWIDPDHDMYNHGQGAEMDYYAELNDPYKPLNKPLPDFSSLYLIKDIPPEMIHFLKQHFTVHGDGKINIHFSSDITLAWLGFSPSLIDKLNRYFKGPDDLYHTEDDQYFSQVSLISTELNAFEPLTHYETTELTQALPLITLQSTYFSAHIHLHYNAMPDSVIYKVFFHRTEQSVEALYMQEVELY